MAKKKIKYSPTELKIQKTILKEINYQTERIISFSQFYEYSKCAWNWYLTYEKKLKPYQPSIHTTFGTAIHETLQEYIKTMYSISGAEADRINVNQLLHDKLIETYTKEYNKSKNHFTSSGELREFLNDGIQILDYFKKNRKKYFSSKNVRLVGIELPLYYRFENNLILVSYLDIVLYYPVLNKIKIIDLKTSTMGWKDWDKKDKIKTSQLILYKKYLSDLYQIPLEDIDIEYIILKRKIPEESEYPISRIQSFIPTHGKTTVNRISILFEQFKNNIGKSEENFPKNVSEFSCKWCYFNDKPKLCNKKNK